MLGDYAVMKIQTHKMHRLVFSLNIFFTLLAVVDSARSQIWTQTIAPNTNWISVTSSADGFKLVAAAGGNAGTYTTGPLYTSTNSGSTWIWQTNVPNMRWQAVASSADGNHLAAAAGSQIDGAAYRSGIFTSTNAGLNWVSNSLPELLWEGVASSADGSKLIAVSFSSVFTSTNFGVAWRSNTVSGYGFETCASSADGTVLMVGGLSGPISISTNSGATWTQELFSGGWCSFATSADGSKLAAFSLGPPDGPGIFLSTNFGGSWSSTNLVRLTFQYLASSADGVKLALAAGGIYTSTNAGNTWVSNNVPSKQWNSIASSADGNKLVATVQGGGIWTLQTTPAPQLNLTTSNTNLALSWLIPSASFILEQSPDLISWSSVTDALTLDLTNLNYELKLSPSNNISFYRLATP
jgi:hypothetical protein